MTSSIFIAKVLGPYCVIAGLGILMNRQDINKYVDDFMSITGLRYLGAILALIFGLLIVNTHNVWAISWVVFITIIGWIALIKGIILFMFPKWLVKVARIYQNNGTLLTINCGLIILLGVFLSVKGYF